MRTVLIAIGLVMATLPFVACHGDAGEVDTAGQDSLRKAQEQGKVVFKNQDLIQPPDSDYTGNYIDRYKNGVIKFRGDFRFGKRHGQWLAFYLNGEKWSECFYDKGMKQGASNIYYPNGKLQRSGWYKNDHEDSTWVFYDSLGKLEQTVFYKEGHEIPKPATK